MLIVFTTLPNPEEAETLARKIVEAKLAACVQVMPQMKSFFFWGGAIQSESEHLLIIKTIDSCFSGLEEFIQTHHSYEVPEIVAIDAKRVSESYFNWITDNTAITD